MFVGISLLSDIVKVSVALTAAAIPVEPVNVTVLPVTTDCHEVPPGLYVFKSEAGIVFIVPPSLTTIPSASAKVIELPTDVPPSNRFNSAAVAVTAVPLIANLSVTTLNVALSSILATSVPSLC